MASIDEAQLFGILKKFKNSNHPEIIHFRQGNHPGKDWYLKTICPMPHLDQIDQLGYGDLWDRLSGQYPDIIRIVPQAYDWDGNEIPYMVSVWLSHDSDVVFHYNEDDEQLEVIFIEHELGQQMQTDKMDSIVAIEMDGFVSNIAIDADDATSYAEELMNVEKIIDFLKTQTYNNNIDLKDFKIIKGGKNTNGKDEGT